MKLVQNDALLAMLTAMTTGNIGHSEAQQLKNAKAVIDKMITNSMLSLVNTRTVDVSSSATPSMAR